VQYDISDPEHPRFVSRLWLGGLIRKGGGIKVGAAVAWCGAALSALLQGLDRSGQPATSRLR
jgi:hypothetical protein